LFIASFFHKLLIFMPSKTFVVNRVAVDRSMRWWFVLGVAGWSLAWAGRAEAGLTWERETIAIEALVGDKQAVGSFAYRNDTDKPITITGTRYSCACSSSLPGSRVVQPGESGTLDVAVYLGTRRTPTSVRVEVEQNSKETDVLMLQVGMRELVAVDRTALIWDEGSMETKSVLLRTVGNERIQEVQVKMSGEAMQSRIEVLEQGSRYRLDLTPSAPPTRALRETATLAVTCEGRPTLDFPIRLRAK
jgi:hypothetical protein